MTVSSTLVRQRYTGTGAATTFACNFRVLDATHLVVSRIVGTVVTTLVLGTDYTVVGVGAVSTASVVLTAALAIGTDVLIQRVVPLLQPTDIRNQGAFYASIHEDAFDRHVMQVQQVASDLSRSLRLGATDVDGSGAYRANGNRFSGAANGVLPTDLVTLQQLAAGGGSGTGVSDTYASASFGSGGTLNINVLAPSTATTLRAAVSTVAQPTSATVDAATGSLQISASQGVLTSTGPYAVGTTVYISVRSYIAGVGGRLVTLVVNRDADTGATVATGPSLTMSASWTATTCIITYTATGTVTQSVDGGAFVAAAASPITFARNAPGGLTRSVSFVCTLAGQSIPDAFTIPAQNTTDTDTVTPDLTVTDTAPTNGGTAALHQQWTVTATNPKIGGAAPTIVVGFDPSLLTAQYWTGAAWAALATGAVLTSGQLVRAVRPVFTTYPQVITFVASLGVGNGTERISRTVQNQDVVLNPRVIVRQVPTVGAEATQVTVTVTTDTGTGTVRWTGGGTRVSGPLLNVDVASGATWVFARPAFNTGEQEATFLCTVNGLTDPDSTTIAEIGRDTVGLLARAIPTSSTTTTTVRVTGSNQVGVVSGFVIITQTDGLGITRDGAAVGLGNIDALGISTVDGDTSVIGGIAAPAFRDYVVTRPPIGAVPARFNVRVSAPGFTSDGDGVDIQPQEALTPGRIELISTTESGAIITIRWRAYFAGGVQETSGSNISVRTYATLPGSAEGAAVDPGVAYDAVNVWFTSSFTRVAGTQYRVQLLFNPGTGGTAQTITYVTVPIYTAPSPWSPPPFVNVPTTFGAMTINFTYTNAPGGVTYNARVVAAGVSSVVTGIVTGGSSGVSGKLFPGGGFSTLRYIDVIVDQFSSAGALLDSRTIPTSAYYIAP